MQGQENQAEKEAEKKEEKQERQDQMDAHPSQTPAEQSPQQKDGTNKEKQIAVFHTPFKTTETTPTSTSKPLFEALLSGFPQDVSGMFEVSMDIQKYI